MKNLILIMLITLATTVAFASKAPKITTFHSYSWSSNDVQVMLQSGAYTNCHGPGFTMTCDDEGRTNYTACAFASKGIINVTFNAPSKTANYYVYWQPWRRNSNDSFWLDGVLYDGAQAQKWIRCSPALTPVDGANTITYTTGFMEDVNFYMIVAEEKNGNLKISQVVP